MDPRGAFTGRERAYRRARPGYPVGALAAVIDGLGSPAGLTVADVGAGTGISARGLAGLGARVIGVEPNAAMRGAAGAHEGVEWREGTAEDTGLAAGSVDAVVCAQAYHWFDPGRACAEFRRILRPAAGGGRLALVWNDPDEGDEATGEYLGVMREGAGVEKLPHEAAARRPVVVGFAGHREVVFVQSQRLGAAGLLERARSTSYFPADPARAAWVEGRLKELHERRQDGEGLVGLRYAVRVHLYEAERV